MKAISKKEIKKKVSTAMNHALAEIEISKPSKKARKLLNKVTKKLSAQVKKNLTVKTKSAKDKKVNSAKLKEEKSTS